MNGMLCRFKKCWKFEALLHQVYVLSTVPVSYRYVKVGDGYLPSSTGMFAAWELCSYFNSSLNFVRNRSCNTKLLAVFLVNCIDIKSRNAVPWPSMCCCLSNLKVHSVIQSNFRVENEPNLKQTNNSVKSKQKIPLEFQK